MVLDGEMAGSARGHKSRQWMCVCVGEGCCHSPPPSPFYVLIGTRLASGLTLQMEPLIN